MQAKATKYPKTTALAILAYLCLAIFTAFNNFEVDAAYTDETYHLANVTVANEDGLSKAFLEAYYGAAGPLFAVIQYLAQPFTQGVLSRQRLINVFLLGLVILLIQYLMRQHYKEQAWAAALSILFIPTTYISAGMGLTELASVATCLLALLLLLQALRQPKIRNKLFLSLVTGLMMGLCIFGRQTYLVVLPFFLLLYFYQRHKIDLLAILLFQASALVLPLYTFSVWGGLVEPKHQNWVDTGLVPLHGLLAFAYCSLFFFLIAPHWFRSVPKKWLQWAIAFALLVLFTNGYFNFINFLPVKAILWQLPASAQYYIGNLFGSSAIGLAVYFIYCCYIHGQANRKDVLYLFMLTSLLVLLGSCVAISHVFGSRYVFQAIPFVLFLAYPHIKDSWYLLLLKLFGIVVGGAGLLLTLQIG